MGTPPARTASASPRASSARTTWARPASSASSTSSPGSPSTSSGPCARRVYDDMVKDFCANIGIENLGKRLVNSKDGDVNFENPNMSLDNLLEYGKLLVGEQENVKRVQLADSYLDGAELAGVGGSSMPEKSRASKLPTTRRPPLRKRGDAYVVTKKLFKNYLLRTLAAPGGGFLGRSTHLVIFRTRTSGLQLSRK